MMKPKKNIRAKADLDQHIAKTSTAILAGGKGTRLMSLTEQHAKPAVPVGGSFRIIDFTLSNCLNSGFNRINVLTQYQKESLASHLQKGWEQMLGGEGYIRQLPASELQPYEGTADAIYKNIETLKSENCEWVLILAGDHIYKMDYSAMLEEHIENGADVTVPCVEVPRKDATGFGVMHIDAQNRIIDFLEKPADPPGMPDNPDKSLASMGIYIFNAKLLISELEKDAANPDSAHDFGRDIIPSLVPRAKVMAHRFANSCAGADNDVYWRDVGTVDAYWEANMDLAEGHPGLNPNDQNWPIFTAEDPLQSLNLRTDGTSNFSDIRIRRSVLARSVQVDATSNLQESVLLPDVRIGRDVKLRRVIVESGCRIPDGLVVGEDADEDARRFYRTINGVVLINNSMLTRLST